MNATDSAERTEIVGCAGGSPGSRKDSIRAKGVYWRSIEEFADSPEFREIVENEFPSSATDLVTGEDRRQFIKVMGASFALAGLAISGCRRWPEEKIVPFAARPEDRIPGQTVQYATALEIGGCGFAVLASSYDGRPIKIEGNDAHPTSGGRSSAFVQASILDLYDQDRSRDVYRGGTPGGSSDPASATASNWAAFADFAGPHFKSLGAAGGAGLAVLAEASASPTRQALRDRLLKEFPKTRWFEYEPVNDDAEREGTRIALGAPHRVHLSFDNGAEGAGRRSARVVLSLDADFLFDHPDAVRHAREFARTRRVATSDPAQATMSRLYVFDSGATITGVASDERLPLRACDVPSVAALVASQLLAALGGGGGAGTGALASSLAGPLAALASREIANPLDAHGKEVIELLVKDLTEAKGDAIVVAGRHQPGEVHALAAAMNEALGAVGRGVTYTLESEPNRPSNTAAIRAVRDGIVDGSITTLVVLGANPVYTAPADLDFAAALAKVPTSIHLGQYRDETGRRTTWHLPRPHGYESWGDTRTNDGTYTVIQPLIAPMIDAQQGARSSIELLADLSAWMGGRDAGAATGLELVRGSFQSMTGLGAGDLDRRWNEVLREGFLAGSSRTPASAPVRGAETAKALGELATRLDVVKPAVVEVTFRPDPKILDGRFVNNGWLQELPDPVTKLTWDNAAVMSMGTAAALGVKTGDLVSLTCGGRSMEIAAYVLPGHPDNTIRLTLGYGRTAEAGRVGEGAGFDTYRLRSSEGMSWAAASSVTKGAGTYTLVSTQDRGAGNPVADAGVQERLPTLLREASLASWKTHTDFAKHPTADYHVAHRLSLWEETNLDGAKHRWAMSIDLSTCTGCNACVIACQAENNIPVVGKEQVRRGREMHWIRIDRYFRGDDQAHPEKALFQPVTCLHCENAPCEQVCPVAATVHDEDGLNTMIYNRCVGTRYCSNNCPYKVRRFNYFDWHRKDPARGQDWVQHQPGYFFREGADEWKRLQFNPDVTVRMRGVMEKCTFCTQRITKARIDAKNAWAKAGGRAGAGTNDYQIADGAITPACAHACPSEAIVFGDLNDRNSRVAKLHQSKLAYEMLEELNTKPRLKYLARVSNPGHEHGHGHGHDHDHDHDHGHDHGAHS